MGEVLELARLTRDELAELGPETTVVLAIGATEQHGDHLPLGVDTLVADTVARGAIAACEPFAPLVLAPTLAYGRSDHHLGFPGVLSVQSDTLLAVLRDLARSVVESGLSRLFVVNGHGGNDAVLRAALADAADAHPLTVGGAGYWTIAWEALRAAGADGTGPVPGHAGGFETSLVLAIEEGLVRLDRRSGAEPVSAKEDPAARVVFARHRGMHEFGGTSDDARYADAETGRRLLGVIVASVAAAIDEFQRRAA